MSYEVLARKWRPQTFDELVGQDHIAHTLRKAVESSRLSHAYLLSGPRGSGKTSTARILAKVINCSDVVGGNPCNRCDSCLGVMQGKNLDVMEIDGASHTGVAEVRDLQESIGYAPSQFSKKVYIIDEVHMLSAHAFNALLKTLEEPPSHVYFIFATTAPHKIPDTIKSRCQRHQFKRLEIGEISAQLEKICQAERVEFEKEGLRLLACKAEGSMRDGESLLDQVITASSGKVKTTSVREILGLLDLEMLSQFLRAMAEGDSTEVLRRLDAAVQEGVDLEELLNALIEGFRDLMLLASPGDLSELIYRSQDEIQSLRELLPRYEVGDLVTIVERLCNVGPRLKMASDPRILMESVLVDLTLLDRQTNLRELINTLQGSGTDEATAKPAGVKKAPRRRLSEAERNSGTPPAKLLSHAEQESFTKPRAKGVATAAETPTSGGDEATPSYAKDVDLISLDHASLNRVWDGFVTYVRQKKVALGVCLISGRLKSFDDGAFTIDFSKSLSFQRDQVERATNRKFLKGMMSKYFGRDLELVCVSGEREANGEQRGSSVVPGSGDAASGARPIDAKPIVKKILSDFDGEIIRYHPQ